MKTAYFDIDLLQPVIISQHSATVGTHQSLGYIAGSAILGLVASKLYNSLTADEAFLVFHSGQVRFLDAMPLQDNEVGYPVPFNLHSFKGENYEKDGRILVDKVFDISSKSHDYLNHRQPTQLRNFYLTHSGKRLNPQKELTLKTAIDPLYNRAAESQLFGYEALSKGQFFRFSVQADASIDNALWQKILETLQDTAFLGRSRSAQFGKVKINSAQNAQTDFHGEIDSDILTLWLTSDLCVQDDGQPTLQPTAKALSLPQGCEWIADKSFIRSREYSIYNAYRKHYDKQRVVIARGSVLRYKLTDNCDRNTLLGKLHQGIGLYRESGLGQVIVNPIFLGQSDIIWQKISPSHQVVTKDIATPSTPFITKLQQRLDKTQGSNKVHLLARDIFGKLCQKVRESRKYHALRRGQPFEMGKIPTRTQFGILKELASQNRNQPSTLWTALNNGTSGVLYVKELDLTINRQSGKNYSNSGWELAYSYGNDDKLGKFFLQQLQPHKDTDDFPQLIGELAVLGMSDIWEKCSLGLDNLSNSDKAQGEQQ